ncbi:unnamed protein product [Pylaiella littoralis]
MIAEKIKPRGPGAVEVTAQIFVGGIPRYLWVNRLFIKIGELDDGSISAWPGADFQGWMSHDNDRVVRLFVLSYLLAGCNFLPAMSGLPFEKMWVVALKNVRAEGVCKRPRFFQEGEVWMVNVDECIKLVATICSSLRTRLRFVVAGEQQGAFLPTSKRMYRASSTSSEPLSSTSTVRRRH